MTLRQLFIASLSRFQDLKNARRLSFGKVVLYLLCLSLVMAIPITTQIWQAFQNLQADTQEIAAKIPDFTIQDGKLTTADATEGFIYQTDSIIFTFDPEGKRNANDIAKDQLGNFLSVGLLPDKVVISMPATNLSTQLLGSNQLELKYSQGLTSLDGAHIRAYLGESRIPWWILALSILISIYPAFINLLMTVLISAFGGVIMIGFRRVSLSYFETLKILIFSATLPVILSVIVSLLVPSFDTSVFIILASLFIFSQAIKDLPSALCQINQNSLKDIFRF